MPRWHFERPGVGLDTGGDISKAFRGESHDLPGALAALDPGHSARLLARELIQNAVDAHSEHADECADRGAKRPEPLSLEFEFETLEGQPLQRFVDAVQLSEMDTRADTVGYPELHLVEYSYFEGGDTTRPLRILRIHERRTTGMHGPWAPPETGDAERRLHSALLDFGTSAKSGRAGGSYGYGKAGLATASRLRMVFVYTCFEPRPNDSDAASRRLLGVAYWDRHRYDDVVANGVGIFGNTFPGHPDLASPLNDDEADIAAEALGLPVRARGNPDDLGTSFVIIDPDFDAEALQRSVELFWWPAIRRGTIQVSIRDADTGKSYAPRPRGPDGALTPFVTALSWLDDPGTAPQAGDDHGMVKELRSQTQNRLNEPIPSPGRLALIVDPDEGSWSWADPSAPTLIALIRGTNMVIAYQEQRTGLPCARGVFSASDDADPLLRATETKAHDKWESKRDPGIPARASQMAEVTKQRIRDAVKDFVGSLKPEPPKREISLEHFGKFFTGKKGITPPRPVPTRDAWSIEIKGHEAIPTASDPASLSQSGVVSIGLSGNTDLTDVPVTVTLRFGAAEDDSGFGTEGLELAEVQAPAGWALDEAKNSDPATRTYSGTLSRSENADFVVTSAAYPESWSCGFQAIVTPADGSEGEA